MERTFEGAVRDPRFEKDSKELMELAFNLAKKEGIIGTKGRYEFSNKDGVGAGTTAGGLLYYDIKPDTEQLRVMQQNPHTSTEWARLKREDKLNVWQVMYRNYRGYVGVIVDGLFYRYTKRS